MLPRPARPIVVTHWGTYRATMTNEQATALEPMSGDPDPSPIARSLIDPQTRHSRILRPAVRASFLRKGSHRPQGRGQEPFIEIPWDEALDLVAGELHRVRADFGNKAIFGGSYGWASAGRFHHAQSQIHRFLNVIGGYTRSVNTYSTAAAEVIVPYVLGDTRGLVFDHTTWPSLEKTASLVVMFGGTPLKNAQVNSGGISRHILRESLLKCRKAGVDFINISPIRDDLLPEAGARWMPVRPTTDVALMLGIAHTLIEEGRHDRVFLDRYTTGFPQFEAYVTGLTDGVSKSAAWASGITGLAEDEIKGLAREMASRRTMIMMAWALQRAEHGEQPYWMAITLAAMLGQIGLPGGGFGFGYGSINGIGNPVVDFPWPSLPQGRNPVSDFIPVARIADMLLNPGGAYEYNGSDRTYPDARLIYWAGGNPFHHHQDLNRLVKAWQRPETIIVHETWWNALARHADIVLPVMTQLERDDLACSSRDRLISPSHRVREPDGEARTDYDIFSALSRRLGCEDTFTEGRDAEAWIRHLYETARSTAITSGHVLPDFETFWGTDPIILPEPERQPPLLAAFRDNPATHPLRTPSGKIEIVSETIASFGYAECPGHPTWIEPSEWLGSVKSELYPLHMISNQPATKLHSQYDHGINAREAKIKGREPVRLHPHDAARRSIAHGDIVRIFNDRGSCLAGAVLSEDVTQGVIQLATGAWYDPEKPGQPASIDKHGNPNVLTEDRGTSRLAQGPIAHSCLVEVERHSGPLPPITAYDPPHFLKD